MELINEIACLLIVYFLLCFTGLMEDGEIVTVFVIDAKTRNQVGLVLISLTLTNFLIDISPILFDIKFALKTMYHKRKAKRTME